MDISVRLKILSRMAQSETEAAKSAITKEIKVASAVLDSETDYARLDDSLAILRVIGVRESELATTATIAFIDSIEHRRLTHSEEQSVVSLLKDHRTIDSLLARAVETLSSFRYLQTPKVLHALMHLTRHSSERVRKKAVNGLELIAKYDLAVFFGNEESHGIGASPQIAVLSELESMRADVTREYFSACLSLLDNLLSPELEGTTWTSNAMSLSRAGIPASAGIPEVRTRSIKLLKQIYVVAPDLKHKLRVIGVLTSATRSAHARPKGDVADMFIRNSEDVLSFFAELAGTHEFEIVQKVEHVSYWIFFHAFSEDIRTAALRIEVEIGKNAEYQIFRALIGFDGIFGKWSDKKDAKFDPSKTDVFRKQLANGYVESIGDNNSLEWRTRILKFAEVESDDLATFPIFYYFLESLSTNKPAFALKLVSADSERLKRFLIPLFRGLWVSAAKKPFRELLASWIDKGQYLYAATKQFLSNANLDVDLLTAIFDKAKATNDLWTIREMVAVAVSNHMKGNTTLLDKLMLPALEILTRGNDATWIFDAWFRNELEIVLNDLDEKGIDLILRNLFVLKKIDYHAERVLAGIARRFPEKVLLLLVGRLHAETRSTNSDDDRFEPIPFEMHELKEPLATIPDKAVSAVRREYDGNYGLFIYRGARLLKGIFPDFPPEFETELMGLVGTGENADIEFVLAVLRNYEGPLAIHGICREIIKVISPDNSLRAEVAVALESTGVVRGEFGLSEAYDRKAAEVTEWMNDPDEKIRDFAKEYYSNLKAMSTAERKRAHEQIELRKFRYGES